MESQLSVTQTRTHKLTVKMLSYAEIKFRRTYLCCNAIVAKLNFFYLMTHAEDLCAVWFPWVKGLLKVRRSEKFKLNSSGLANKKPHGMIGQTKLKFYSFAMARISPVLMHVYHFLYVLIFQVLPKYAGSWFPLCILQVLMCLCVQATTPKQHNVRPQALKALLDC